MTSQMPTDTAREALARHHLSHSEGDRTWHVCHDMLLFILADKSERKENTFQVREKSALHTGLIERHLDAKARSHQNDDN